MITSNHHGIIVVTKTRQVNLVSLGSLGSLGGTYNIAYVYNIGIHRSLGPAIRKVK
jgi:hypothetical protein